MLKTLYLIVGRSGSGKTTIVEELQKRWGFTPLASYTDRPPRYEGETSHTFVTTEEFDALGEMMAYTRFNGHQYGANQALVDRSDLYVIDPAGIYFMRERYKSDRPIKIIGIHVPTKELEKRMLKRGDTPEMVASRTANDDKMFENMFDVCDVVFKNDDLEKTIQQVHQYIVSTERNLMVIPEIEHELCPGLVIMETLLFNADKISEDDAIRLLKSGEPSPYALLMDDRQWHGLFDIGV